MLHVVSASRTPYCLCDADIHTPEVFLLTCAARDTVSVRSASHPRQVSVISTCPMPCALSELDTTRLDLII